MWYWIPYLTRKNISSIQTSMEFLLKRSTWTPICSYKSRTWMIWFPHLSVLQKQLVVFALSVTTPLGIKQGSSHMGVPPFGWLSPHAVSSWVTHSLKSLVFCFLSRVALKGLCFDSPQSRDKSSFDLSRVLCSLQGRRPATPGIIF